MRRMSVSRKRSEVTKDGWGKPCDGEMFWCSMVELPDILGGEVFEMKRNASELGCFTTNTNKISEQDIFCEVYGS